MSVPKLLNQIPFYIASVPRICFNSSSSLSKADEVE